MKIVTLALALTLVILTTVYASAADQAYLQPTVVQVDAALKNYIVMTNTQKLKNVLTERKETFSSAEEVIAEAKKLRLAGSAVGDYTFENWNSLSKGKRQTLLNIETSYYNLATDLVTCSVSAILDDAKAPISCDVILENLRRKAAGL